MAKTEKLKIEINVVALAKSAAGSSRSKQDAYVLALSESVKREFGKRIIDAIIERTLNGDDKNGESFVGYSDSFTT